MKIDLTKFCVPEGKRIQLKDWATETKPFYDSKQHYEELLAEDVHELSALQRLLYASNTYSLLLVFQGMDSAGKDGAISHILSGINPQGCEVHSFKQPSAEELAHDFLWRTTCRLPARGRIGVFNRSYYEEVLVVRVHREALRGEGVSDEAAEGKDIWERRYRSIVGMEKHLHRSGTRVIKFFLHLSKQEQRKRLLDRIDDPDKNWKFSQSDVAEREFWSQYIEAYEDFLGATSTDAAPWYIVPADDKHNARLIMSRVVIDALKGLNMSYPELTRERLIKLREIRGRLAGSN